MKFDEINKLFKAYFKVMDISEEDKRKREECAFFFYDAVWYVLTMIRLDNEPERLADEDFYIKSLEYRLGDRYEADYIPQVSREIVETTFRHLDEEYFLSEDRAVLIAQNEANTVLNSADYKQAKKQGKKYKTWMTELDNRVRPWHEEVNGVKIPIDDMFQVGNDSMRFPHDINGSPENIVNCRCSCKYE